ncbi:MAG TPA: hypothetical protein VMH22_15060 [bacterium]|nr:hypothetical protein [bacterium]
MTEIRHEPMLSDQPGVDIEPRIGIFQAEWPLAVHTVNAARVLAESGFCVDLFLYRVREDLVDGAFDGVKDVRVIRVAGAPDQRVRPAAVRGTDGAASRRKAIKRAFYKSRPLKLLWELCRAIYVNTYVKHYPVWLDRQRGLMPVPVIRDTLRAMNGNRYRALIGMEKAGLVWAGLVGERIHVPYIYHSLELYTREFYGSLMAIKTKRLKWAEERYHRGSYATIVQDEGRGRVLFADNRVKPERVLYVPVSLMGPARHARSSFLQERFHLNRDHRLILQFGWLQHRRLCVELAQLAQRFPEDWTLVMHGEGASADYLERIRAADTGHRVRLSLDLTPASQVPDVVSSARVGLALYSAANWNDRLTAYSSERVALYLQCGLPVIAFDYPGFDILESRRCGAVIKSLDELRAAIERVLASWDEFSYNARALFAERYEFGSNYQKVVEMLGTLPTPGKSSRR